MSLPAREELMTMPMTILEHQNIESQEEECLIQEILDKRRATMPIQREIYRNDAIAAHIDTKEKEAEWQKIIDDRVEKVKPRAFIDDLEPEPNEPTNEPIAEPLVKPLEAKAKFCQFCDSKGVKHKLNCTRKEKV